MFLDKSLRFGSPKFFVESFWKNGISHFFKIFVKNYWKNRNIHKNEKLKKNIFAKQNFMKFRTNYLIFAQNILQKI
jgi:hypothetical protein